MPRYRDMTTPELVAWARDWVAEGPAGRLIYALAARLEQEHQPTTPPPEPDAPAVQPRERADTIDDVIKLGRLSREARDYLASKGRPIVPLADRPAAGYTSHAGNANGWPVTTTGQCNQPHPLVNLGMQGTIRRHPLAIHTTADAQCYITPSGAVVPFQADGHGGEVHPIGHVPAPCSVWPIGTRGY